MQTRQPLRPGVKVTSESCHCGSLITPFKTPPSCQFHSFICLSACLVSQVTCVTVPCQHRLVPCRAGPSPPQSWKPSSPSTCCLVSMMWALPHIIAAIATEISLFSYLSKLILFILSHFFYSSQFCWTASMPRLDVQYPAGCMSPLPTPFQIYHLWCRKQWHFHTSWGVELIPWCSSCRWSFS